MFGMVPLQMCGPDRAAKEKELVLSLMSLTQCEHSCLKLDYTDHIIIDNSMYAASSPGSLIFLNELKMTMMTLGMRLFMMIQNYDNLFTV